MLRGCGFVLVGLALVFSLIAFYEFSTETLLLNPKLLISNQFHTYFRVNSVFFDPNIFGRYLMLTMIGLSAVLLDSRRGRTVAAAAACIAVLLAAMVMTLSQSSLIGLLVGYDRCAPLGSVEDSRSCGSGRRDRRCRRFGCAVRQRNTTSLPAGDQQ